MHRVRPVQPICFYRTVTVVEIRGRLEQRLVVTVSRGCCTIGVSDAGLRRSTGVTVSCNAHVLGLQQGSPVRARVVGVGVVTVVVSGLRLGRKVIGR